jgi:hypothetical protein
MGNHLINILRRLLGFRSPSLEFLGHYECQNCQHHNPNCTCVVCKENPDILLCNLKKAHVTRFYTCKHAKPITIKPLRPGKFKRGNRFETLVIDEWSGDKIEFTED